MRVKVSKYVFKHPFAWLSVQMRVQASMCVRASVFVCYLVLSTAIHAVGVRWKGKGMVVTHEIPFAGKCSGTK